MLELTWEQWEQAQARMAAPFDPAVVDFMPANYSDAAPGKRMEVLCYADAREYMKRLDDGLHGQWSFKLNVLATAKAKVEKWDAEVPISGIGVLTLPGGIVHEAYGEASNIAPGKGLWSDCLKLCAVQAGVGRCMYDTPRFMATLNQYKKVGHEEAERLRAYLAELWGVAFTPSPAPPEPQPRQAQAQGQLRQQATQATQATQAPKAATPVAQQATSAQPQAQGQGQGQAPAVKMAHPNDLATLRRGYKSVGEAEPEGLDEFTAAQAKAELDRLSAAYRERVATAKTASDLTGK